MDAKTREAVGEQKAAVIGNAKLVGIAVLPPDLLGLFASSLA
jgi:hypothetical protein